MKRRADIDLLRATAVLCVLFFHFEIPGFEGGYLGVDIFFVISGYLITAQIRKELKAKEFGFTVFFARRIRRLAPAFFAVLAVTSLASLFLLPIQMLEEMATSVLASSIYVSNFYFWSLAGYFDSESITKPLLHTWSLSVEEQFYLFWPLLLIFAHRCDRGAVIVVAAGLSSLIATEVLKTKYPDLVFYHFPFRVFEFSAGAAVAMFKPMISSRRQNNAMLVLAVAGIVFSLCSAAGGKAGLGIDVLPLSIGTAVLIAIYHPLFSTNNYLIRSFRYLGVRSYSIYLVHWPLLVLYRAADPAHLTLFETTSLIFSTIIVAEVLYQFVERPFLLLPVREYSRIWGLMVPVMVSGGLIFQSYAPALGERFAATSTPIKEILDAIPDRKVMLEEIKVRNRLLVQASEVEKKRKLLVVGDSHAVDVFYALQFLLVDTDVEVALLHSICDPLTRASIGVPLQKLYADHSQITKDTASSCETYHETLAEKIDKIAPTHIIFSEAWRLITLDYLAESVSDLKAQTNASMLLLGKNPIFAPHPAILFRDLKNSDQVRSAAWQRRYKHLENGDITLSVVASATSSFFISKNSLICPSGLCDLVLHDEFGMVDSNHWSKRGMHVYGLRLINHELFKQFLEF